MKKIILTLLGVSALIFVSCKRDNKTDKITNAQKQEMRASAKEFMAQLKGILFREMKAGGVQNAVAVCSDTAQILTNNFGLQRGVYIRRVSFKNRNKNDYPDEFEGRVLQQFEQMKSGGNLSKKSEHIEIVKENDHKYLRYMKPIFVGAACLNCHGSSSDISLEVKNILSEDYPDDKAINYKTGDLRGAVSVKKLIE